MRASECRSLLLVVNICACCLQFRFIHPYTKIVKSNGKKQSAKEMYDKGDL